MTLPVVLVLEAVIEGMLSSSLVVVAVAALAICGVRADSSDSSSEQSADFSAVTCGSAIKLRHTATGFLLHSHNIKWGSGSGQQSVTAVEASDDPNSLWQIKESLSADRSVKHVSCLSGTPIRCGETVRLAHVQTKLHLHSHLHSAPISGRQEISCYGTESQSDTGDNWKVDCAAPAKPGDKWLRPTPITLTHVDTGLKLFTGRDGMT